VRGYFGIGVEGINKPFNVGNLFRTAHAFDASFVFTVAATYRRAELGQSDTSDTLANLPFYALVGVELIDGAADLPSFTHPRRAAYVLGPERASLSPAMLARCDHLLRIPTRFCLNVGIAGALVMYDRMLTTVRFAPRPVMPGGPDLGALADYRRPPPLAEVALVARGGEDDGDAGM
jgi:tRNA G18 (ribose-2'-O)-methylase SpoU